MTFTQHDIDLIMLHNKEVRMKVVVYDNSYQSIGNITGRIKSVAMSVSSESEIRRTCTLTLVGVESGGSISNSIEDEGVWFNRMAELSCGIYDSSINDYKWYPLGKMLIKDGGTNITATNYEIKLSMVDLMASLMQERGSQIGVDVVVPAGSVKKNALAAIIAEFSPFKRYSIPEFEDTVPYDIVTSSGSYPIDSLIGILELTPYYEHYYDHEGVYVVAKIPTKIDDPIEVPRSIIDPLLISENKSANLSSIKNTTEIWGRSLDAIYTALECDSIGSIYNLYIDDTFKTLEEGSTYGFTPDSTSSSGQAIKIQDSPEYQIYTQSGDGEYTLINKGALQQDIPYVVRYTNEMFVLQGELEIHVIVQEVTEMPSNEEQQRFKENNACRDVQWIVNPDSPFAATINGIGQISKEVRQVLQDGEYSNIYTTQLAFERARYENWLKIRMQDTITLEMILIPWLDVNSKIEYTSPKTGEATVVIVQGIDYDFSKWTMTVKCAKFYPYYPWE